MMCQEIIDKCRKYGFTDEIIIELFKYCNERNALCRNYIIVVADSWNKNNIRTKQDLEKYFEQLKCIDNIVSKIIEIKKLSRQLSEYEKAYIEKWLIDNKISKKEIISVIKSNREKSFDAIDEILYHRNNKEKVIKKNK